MSSDRAELETFEELTSPKLVSHATFDSGSTLASSRRHLLSKRTRIELSPINSTLAEFDESASKR